MKNRVLSVLLALVILLTLLPTAAWAEAAAPASGTDWALDADGKLTISSNAGMENWYSHKDSYKDSVISVEIQNDVTSIINHAFDSCQNLTSITIPESVTSIGNWVFDGCQNLTSITIPKNVESIGKRAFAECSSLTSIALPESMKSIGEYAFRDCAKLASITIPENAEVTSIGDYVFNGCMALESITIPGKVTSIGGSAFSGCSRLTSIMIPESVTSIGNSAFENCQKLTSIAIPKNVISIGDSAFSGCSILTSITIPENVTSIYNAARVLAVVVPYDFTGKQRVTVYRCHSGKAEALAEASTQADGTFALDKSNGTVTIYASKFSTYAIGYTAAGQAATYTLTVNGGTGSGSYAADTIVKISATVPSGQRFTGWTGADVANSGSASTTLVMPAQNTTVTANFQKISDGGGGGGSGGSDSTTYPVETSGADGGKVTVSPKNAASGTTVTLTLTPDAGYAAGGVTVTDGNGKQIVVTAIGDRNYTFTMPSGKVTVTGVFIKITDGYQDCPRDRTCPIWPYTDANPKAWYHDGVHYCLANGIMVGTSETTFEPNANTTRGQVVTMLYRVEQEPAAAVSAKFKDVLDGMYYTQAVAWAEANGIVEGHSEVRFAPDDRVTREQLGAILYRYARFKGRAADERGSLDGFADGGAVSAYAREAMRWAVGSGLMEGDEGGLRPAGNATRAETATLFWRFLNKWTDG